MKIRIRAKERTYQYDSFHLIKEFYPACEIVQEVDAAQTEALRIESYGEEKGVPDAERLSLRRATPPALPICIPEPDAKEKAERKRKISRALYRELSRITGETLAWGILTGVRPTKLPMRWLSEGADPQEAKERLCRESFVSEEKARLATGIALREREILSGIDYKNGYSLYVGIPFCPTICAYCSFSSSPIGAWKKRTDDYLDALFLELSYIARLADGRPLHTVYIGGGTPTTLTAEQLGRLISHIRQEFPCGDLKEFTVEAGRPDSITEEKLRALKRCGVTRISINPQTMQQKTLDRIGRRHTVADVVRTFHLAREMGFDNINMDLIVGLPGETAADVADTLRQIGELAPDSLTVHSLAVKRAAREKLKLVASLIPETADTTARMIEAAAKKAEELGAAPYYLYRQKNIAGNFENVGYAKVDKAGIYNILIMEEMQTIAAAGAGAATKVVFPEENRIERIENVKDVGQYIDRIDEMLERKGEMLWR